MIANHVTQRPRAGRPAFASLPNFDVVRTAP